MKSLSILCLVMIPVIGFSQFNPGLFYIKSIKEPVESGKTSYVKAYRNNIPVSVMKSFINLYPDADDVSWYVNDRDISGYFTDAGRDIKITYKKDGLLLSTRLTYDSSKLQTKVQNFLKRETQNMYSIIHVTEVIKDEETVFEITMEDSDRMYVFKIGQKSGEPLILLDKTNFKKG